MLGDRTILIADDEAAIRLLIRRALASAGCDICEASNGEDAIRILETRFIDLAIIDIVMPEREGLGVIIEARERWPRLKIIAISGGGGLGRDETLDLARIVGANDAIRKPFNFRDIAGRIEALLPVRFAA
jgi:DNA-binding response OmpR family regulator